VIGADEREHLVGFHQCVVLRNGQRAAGERTRQRGREDQVVEAERPVRYPCEAIFRRHTLAASSPSFSMPNVWARRLKEASKRDSGAPLVPGRPFWWGGCGAASIAIEGIYVFLFFRRSWYLRIPVRQPRTLDEIPDFGFLLSSKKHDVSMCDVVTALRWVRQ
jgi:hypothetical protein